DAIVRVLAASVGPGLDKLMLSAAASDVDRRPAGLFAGVAPHTPMAGGGDVAMRGDLAALRASLSPGVPGNQVGLICAKEQIGTIENSPVCNREYVVLPSAALAAGTVAMIAVPALVSHVDGPPSIERGLAATLHEDTQPHPIVDGSGTAAVPVRA